MLWLSVVQGMVSSDTVNPMTPQMNVGASAHPMVASRLKLGPLDYSDLSRGDRSFPDAQPNARIRRRPPTELSTPLHHRARQMGGACLWLNTLEGTKLNVKIPMPPGRP